MRVRPLLLTIGSFVFCGLAGAASGDAIVVVAEDGGFDATTVRSVRSIAATELRKHGVAVRDDARFERVTDAAALVDTDAERIFVLRLGRLDQKVPISLEERGPQGVTPLFVVSHTAASLDEADVVLQRLVRAVLLREPVESGARIRTVTQKESEPFLKKPGEGFWTVGLGLAPLGGSFGWSYEAERWRLGVLLQGAEDDPSFFGVDGAWVPGTGNVSPYLGAGLGIVNTPDDDSVLGTKLEAGVELFRLHGIRLLAGVNAVIPFEKHGGVDGFNPGLHLRFCF